MKILAIDDNRDNLTTLKAVLHDAFPDGEVLTALNGPTGIELALSEDPDVILLDIVMPGMDGFEACRRLKQDDATKHIPIVFLTALKTDRKSRILALDTGAEAFLAKPIDEVELVAQVRAMTRIKAAHVREQNEKDRLAALVTARTQQIVKELSERIEAEKALRESERQKALILNSTSEIVAYYDLDLRVIWANRAAEDSVGAVPGGLVGMRCHEIWAQRDEPCPNCPVQKVGDSREPWEMEQVYPDGRCWHVRGYPVLDELGKHVSVAAFAEDITMRREAEERLRRSQVMLARTERIAHVGSWGWEIARDVVTWSEELFRIHQLDPDKGAPNWAQHHALYHPEDFERLRQAAEKAVSDGTPYELELRALRRDGETRICLAQGFREMGPDGKALRLFGSLQDITDLRRIEASLRESEAWLRAASESSLDSFFIFRAERDDAGEIIDFVFVYVNKTAEEMLQIPRESILGKRLCEVLPINREAGFFEKYKKVLETGIPLQEEFLLPDTHVPAAWYYHEVLPLPDGIAIAHRDITERKRSEAELRASEEKFFMAFHSSPIAMALSTIFEGRFLDVNTEFLKIAERDREEVIGRSAIELGVWEDVGKRAELIEQFQKQGVVNHVEVTGRSKSGRRVSFWWSAVRITLNGEPCLLSSAVDITDMKKAEEEREKLQAQLLQAQKMESVGRLAGGVAHDFNNMLQTILGFADLALMDMSPDDPFRRHAEEIKNAAKRSTKIIRQLLAFARKEVISPVVMDLNDAVDGMIKMLRRLIGEDMDLVWMPGADLWGVHMDPTQIDQILANLVVNARDAIEGVGQVEIRTENAVLDEASCAQKAGCVPGDYVRLSVIDTGSGMDEDTLKNIFDPFFTTKEAGKGTGLGLATVYGIVKQNNGYIYAQSQPGQGSSFQIYLPRHQGSAEKKSRDVEAVTLCKGAETILLVEDRKPVLETGRRMLAALGYTVLTAERPDRAIQIAQEHPDAIHLLMTDVIMPGMKGPDLAGRIRQGRPDIRCLYMSGFTADIIAREGVLNKGVMFIQKPFSLEDLGKKVREALGTGN